MKAVANEHIKNRYVTIDVLRAVAVITMIAAHTIAFFSTRDNRLLNAIQFFGDTVSFPTFLFVSGISTYIAYIQITDQEFKVKKRKLFNRILTLVIAYYTVAFVSSLKKFDLPTNNWFNIVLNILILKDIPGYTEFLIPFIVYGLLVALFNRPITKALKSKELLLIGGSAVIYILGSTLYRVQVQGYLLYPKAILAGHEGLYRFPLFQYLPIFVIGLIYGDYIGKKKILQIEAYKRSLAVLIPSLFVFSIINLVSTSIEPATFERWPPSILFLLTTLTFSISALFLLTKVNLRNFKNNFGYIMSLFWGKYAFGMYTVHIILFQLYNVAFDRRTANPFLLILTFSFIIITCSYIVNMVFHRQGYSQRNSKPLKLYAKSATRIDRSNQAGFLKEKYFWIALIIVTVGFAVVVKGSSVVSMNSREDSLDADGDIESQYIQPEIKGTSDVKAQQWWGNDYSAYRQLTISNEGEDTLNQNSWIRLGLDHRQLVAANKSQPDGSDIKLLYMQNDEYIPISLEISNSNRSNTRIDFQLQKEIQKGQEDNKYFMYYNNNLEEKQESSSENVDPTGRDYAQNYALFTSTETNPLIYGTTSKKWVIKGTYIDEDLTKLKYNLKLDTSISATTLPQYEILGVDIQGNMQKIDSYNYQVTIPTNNLPPGRYHIQATISTANNSQTSQKYGFLVSYPLFINLLELVAFFLKNTIFLFLFQLLTANV